MMGGIMLRVIIERDCDFESCGRFGCYVAEFEPLGLVYSCAEHLADMQGACALMGSRLIFQPVEDVCEACLQD